MSVGYFKNFSDNKYEASIELYYKNLRNLIEYKENSFPEDNFINNVDNQLTFGNGYSYGAELFIKKRLGDFNGWIGYTYSKTMRKFDEIDNGEWFPAKYDRRNDLSIVGQYQINKRVNIGAVFVFATGNSLSLPESRWFSLEENRIITVWSKRNEYRLNPYHRLDISLTVDSNPYRLIKNIETNETEK